MSFASFFVFVSFVFHPHQVLFHSMKAFYESAEGILMFTSTGAQLIGISAVGLHATLTNCKFHDPNNLMNSDNWE